MKNKLKKTVIQEVSLRSDRTVWSAPTDMCNNREGDAEMTLADMYRLAAHLHITMESLYDKYCIPILDAENGGPRMVILSDGHADRKCPFEKNGVCTLGEEKPSSCRMAPLIRNLIPVGSDAWRVGYFLRSGRTGSGTVKYSASDLLRAADAEGTEVAFGHMRLGFYEVYKQCAMLVELTGKSIESAFVAHAMRCFLTEWDSSKSLAENAAKNHQEFRKSVWALTEPRLEKALRESNRFGR